MQDASIRFQLDLFRLDASARATILPILDKMERELLGQLATANLTEFGKARTNQLLAEVRETVKRYYADAQNELALTTQGVAPIAAKAAQTALVATSGGIVLGASLPTETMLAAIASNAMIQGAVQKDWWARQAADTTWRFGTAVRQGMTAGETNAQIITRVRAAIEISRANAAALVQTSVATVANNARMETFSANEDIIKRYRFVTALDQIVCPICAAAADKTWKPGDDRMPQPPLHYNCRCLLVPEVFDGPQGGTRASEQGQVPASTTFKQFLDRQTSEWQNETLGKGRAEMYRDGKITLKNLVDGSGRELTLAQLKSKYK